MPRGKVKLALIRDLEARKTSFRKRKESLMKKLEELSILCDIEACAIMYSPFNPQVEVWPYDITAFQNVLNQFISKSSIDQTKKMLNHESYIKKRISAVKKQINKQMMVNRDMVMENMMSDCLSGKVSVADLNLKDLNDLVSLAGHKVAEIDERIELLKSKAPSIAPQSKSQLPQVQPKPQGHVNGYTPVMEIPECSYGIQTAGWYPEWVGDLLEPDLGHVHGLDMTMPFADVPNPLMSGPSFQKTS